ncbi:hypothetical protein [Nocardia sp. CA-120079]|uniref:hypothetical protein n=1 Tax=Nocardia sp. CA-120079 TaxID=3239974 RepID=UPI003D97D464
MTAIVSVVALGGLLALFAWVCGSFVARVAGALLVLDSLLRLSASLLYPAGLLAGLVWLVIGLALWLLGHRLYVAKHRRWRSMLAVRAWSLPGLRTLAPVPRHA